MLSDTLKKQISLLPDKPGVYLMKDKDDKIIYIGKAKLLSRRVSQYFLRPQSGKVAAMVSHVDHFETIVLKTDKEAFILEQNLIQTHYPRYNIMLMDDSHYPYIALKKGNDPYLKIARSAKEKGYFYFGPFPGGSHAKEVLNLLNYIYPTRKCRVIPSKPCLYYSLGQCLGPCINKIDEEVTKSLYDKIKLFLGGDTSEEKVKLKKKMEEAIEDLNFELAEECKKTLDAIDHVTAKQNVELAMEDSDFDVVSFAEREAYMAIAILTYRGGVLLGKNVHVVARFDAIEEQVLDLLEQYYASHDAPKVIVGRIDSIKELENELDSVKVIIPKEGRYLDMVHLSELNARSELDSHFASARLHDDDLALLEELKTLLKMEKTPYRIELFDNSHFNGDSPVAGMVCYINGEPAKKMYRRYHLEKKDAGDDYHSMVEVVSRRYSRLKEEGSSYPELILTDGGITQVHATLEALAKVEVSIPVFGLYKNDKHQTEGLIDKDGSTYPLERKGRLFFLLMRMQDEVHRYAIAFHKEARGKKMVKSILDDISGLGEKRKELLRTHYPTLEEMMMASREELSQILPKEVADHVYSKLHKEGE